MLYSMAVRGIFVFISFFFATIFFSSRVQAELRYELVREKKYWTYAEKHCESVFGGHLVTITSQSLNNELLAKMRQRNIHEMWLGYSDQNIEGDWRWTNPTARCNDFSNWKSKEPNGGRQVNCATMRERWNGEWNEASCAYKFAFVCEIGAVGEKICPTVEFQYQGIAYELVRTKMTWSQAEYYCSKKGHLATVTSEQVNNVLFQNLDARKIEKVWLGYSDQKREGDWQWKNPAGQCNVFTNWRKQYNEPNGGRKENCGVLQRNWRGQWNDVPCGAKYSFVCEIGDVGEKICPSVKFQYQGIAYEHVLSKITWTQAEDYCKSKKGHLATVTSQKLVDKLLLEMTTRNINELWLGYSDQKSEGNWQWANPAAQCSEYTKWREKRDDLNGGKSGSCGAMYKTLNGDWNNAPCTTKYSFVCEVGAVGEKLCPTVKFQYQGIAYELVRTKMTWTQAENHCKQNKGHLVTVSSQQMSSVLLKKMEISNIIEVWIGYSDQKYEGYWRWTNPAAQCIDFSNWRRQSNEPNGGRDENCGTLYNRWDGEWNDARCENKNSFVCEFWDVADKLCPGLMKSCLTKNGECAQTCTNFMGEIVCGCGEGFTLLPDGKLCTPYELVTGGSVTYFNADRYRCMSVTTDECSKIAHSNGLPFKTFTTEKPNTLPPGCYHKIASKVVYYNDNSSTKECTSERVCLCKPVIVAG